MKAGRDLCADRSFDNEYKCEWGVAGQQSAQGVDGTSIAMRCKGAEETFQWVTFLGMLSLNSYCIWIVSSYARTTASGEGNAAAGQEELL